MKAWLVPALLVPTLFAGSALAEGGRMLVFPGPDQTTRVLFQVPSGSGGAPCGVTAVAYSRPDGRWEKALGPAPKPPSCQFRQAVMPGSLVSYWDEEGPPPSKAPGDYDVTFTVHTTAGNVDGHVSLKAELVDPATLALAPGEKLAAAAAKVGNSVRSEVTNQTGHAVLVGDAAPARNKPQDACGSPVAVLLPNETFVDVRPGLLSKSMDVWLAVFTDPKHCKWVGLKRAKS
jgi:hypothetical protein